jgi:hypothetical protein
VLGVGSIPSVELGSGNYKSQSTKVPENGAYILAEDQDGVGAQFGSSKNYFDYGSGVKNTIATTSENFVTAAGNFSTAEQGSLVAQQLTGVCSSSSSGCTGNSGIQTSINSYKLYPPSYGDYFSGDQDSSIGKFVGTANGRKVLTSTPSWYLMRSPSWYADYDTRIISASGGGGGNLATSGSFGFRPAGVFLDYRLKFDSRTFGPFANFGRVWNRFNHFEKGLGWEFKCFNHASLQPLKRLRSACVRGWVYSKCDFRR